MTKTSTASVGKGSGCTCSPSYYPFNRDKLGKPVKGTRFRDRRVAERELAKIQQALNEGRDSFDHEKNIGFSEWADEFERLTESRVDGGELKPATLTAYRETMGRARESFGGLDVREIEDAELRRFYDSLSAMRPVSRVRHLKQLAACLDVARKRHYTDTNPVKDFKSDLRVKVPKRGKAPFEDQELPRLWAAFHGLQIEPVYLWMARACVETGVRLGEAIALDWQHLNLTEKTLRVAATWDSRAGKLVKPKDGEARVVQLTPHALRVFEEWIGTVGAHDDGPLFPKPRTGGRLNIRMAQRALEVAMVEAAIPKLHPSLNLPRSWHSLRYTFSNVAQRRGYHPRLIEQTLGHASLELSFGVYGGWSPEQLAAEAQAHDD